MYATYVPLTFRFDVTYRDTRRRTTLRSGDVQDVVALLQIVLMSSRNTLRFVVSTTDVLKRFKEILHHHQWVKRVIVSTRLILINPRSAQDLFLVRMTLSCI